MKTSTARVVTYAACAVMVLGGTGLARWLWPGGSESAQRLLAAASEVVGWAVLFVVALRMEPHMLAEQRAQPRESKSATEPHPLAS